MHPLFKDFFEKEVPEYFSIGGEVHHSHRFISLMKDKFPNHLFHMYFNSRLWNHRISDSITLSLEYDQIYLELIPWGKKLRLYKSVSLYSNKYSPTSMKYVRSFEDVYEALRTMVVMSKI